VVHGIGDVEVAIRADAEAHGRGKTRRLSGAIVGAPRAGFSRDGGDGSIGVGIIKTGNTPPQTQETGRASEQSQHFQDDNNDNDSANDIYNRVHDFFGQVFPNKRTWCR
jgi:hypothetical protein